MTAEENTRGVGRDYADDDGGVGAGEADVGYAFAGGTVGTLGGARSGVGRAERRGGEGGKVFGRAGAFCAGVDGEIGLPALGAEGVAGVPVKEGARLSVNGGCGGGEGGVHATFDKSEVAAFEILDELVGGSGSAASGCDVEGKVGGSAVDIV